MSLINEALKKAQKMRNEPQAGANPFAPPQAPVAPQPVPSPEAPAGVRKVTTTGFSGRSVAMIAGGAGLLACICILTTLLVMRRPATGNSPEAPTSSTTPGTLRDTQELPSNPIVQAVPSPTGPGATGPSKSAVPLVQSSGQPSRMNTVPSMATSGSAPDSRETDSQAAPAQTLAVTSQQAPSARVPSALSVAQIPKTPNSERNEGPVISLPPLVGPVPSPVAAPSLEPKASPTPAPAVALSPVHAAPLHPEQPMIQLPHSVMGSVATPDETSLEQAVQQYVAKTRISGIRPGIKVLINGRAYKTNDIVESILGIRLITIGQDHLEFADANGKRYTRGL